MAPYRRLLAGCLNPASAQRLLPPLLKGQQGLVTGANPGMGEAVAIAFDEAGADVMVNHVTHKDAAQAVVARIKNPGSRLSIFHYQYED
jgi:NAD(P)-dependent dehydrogenase (short-subunit alcohol dehydrogenase family)